MKIEVANGEILDRLTILQIKLDHGLPVADDYQQLRSQADSILTQPGIAPLRQILLTINRELWAIEDQKRAHEAQGEFGAEFTALARLVYLLNDERARIKSLIDRMSGSAIREYKSHGDTKCDK